MACPEKKYDYDLIVIGGGSGGLAAAKQAAGLDSKLKVACFDYVKPTPHDTKWGLGGTCVNVGCIPKKLFHYAGLAGHQVEDYRTLGWESFEKKHNWKSMVVAVDNYIRGLNFGYQNQLRDNRVDYINGYAVFEDPHTVSYADDKTKKKKTVTGRHFIIAVGGRPNYPDIPGAQLALTSDDIFWHDKNPGKTLVVGGSYIALECAGFMHEVGVDVTVMVRSILLRGFDQQCANQIGELMERDGVRFVNPATPTELKKLDDGKIQVTYELTAEGNKRVTETFDTVVLAVGRTAVTSTLGLDKAGVEIDAKHANKILVTPAEQTTAPHIFAIGDNAIEKDGKSRPELTPVAIQAGQMLAKRIFAKATALMDHTYIATTVFTPAEYGSCGLSHEDAQAKFGKQNVDALCSRFGSLETAVTYREEIPHQRSYCFTHKKLWARAFAVTHGQEWEDWDPEDYDYEERSRKYMKQPNLAKVVFDKRSGRVLGFHYIGPNAGEVTQGFALAVKLGATKDDFASLVGIHPTNAEEFTTLSTVMSSGKALMKTGGC